MKLIYFYIYNFYMCLKKEKIFTITILLQLLLVIYSYEYDTILDKNSYNFLDNFKLLNYNTFLLYINLILLLIIILFIKRDVNKLIESKFKMIEKMINNCEPKLNKLEKSLILELKGIRYDLNENNIEDILKEFREIIFEINRNNSSRIHDDIRARFEDVCGRVERYGYDNKHIHSILDKNDYRMEILGSKIQKLLEKFNIT